jgi:hypothetical protein
VLYNLFDMLSFFRDFMLLLNPGTSLCPGITQL